MQDGMTIGELARRVGVNIETIRYYERAGLMPHPPRTKGGRRKYSDSDLQTLAFIRKARVSLDIYDPQASDDEMLTLLQKKAARGVQIRFIGELEKKWVRERFAEVRPLRGLRLHVRAIVRDGRRAFVGSQSLRKLELDQRREVGIFIRDRKAVRKVEKVFNADWKRANRKKKSG